MSNEKNAAGLQRLRISFFGCRNVGKSSLVNRITGQDLAVVSPVKGTTTDPVRKAMELLPAGPVFITDTPGFDDEGELGQLRVGKAKKELQQADVAVLVLDATAGKNKFDTELEQIMEAEEIPYILVYNKADLLISPSLFENGLLVSAQTGLGIEELKEKIAQIAAAKKEAPPIVADLLCQGDMVVLVTPIDAGAPKGRLILPQQQTLREILDCGASALVVQPPQLQQTLAMLAAPPKMVITDSQVFGVVAKMLPENIPLTSFSILFARMKGQLVEAVKGAAFLDKLQNGDTVLIAEGCTHHRQCDDIGTVKLPKWIEEYTGKKINFAFTSGGDFPEDASAYQLVVHCGGCMLNGREVARRQKVAQKDGVPFTNYGIAIAQMKGILQRSVSLFPNAVGALGF